MSSWSQFRLTLLATTVGAIGMIAISAGTYILVDYFQNRGDRRRKKSPRNVTGMYNLGNTCFANALLQSLAACPSVELWLSNVGRNVPEGTLSLLVELRKVISCLNHSSEEQTSSADGVLAALRAHRWNLTPEMEQDLFELFNVFVTTWDEELAPFYADKAYSLADLGDFDRSTEVETSSRSHRAEILDSISDSVRARHQYRAPCSGLLGTELHCRICGSKPVRHDRFCSLDLVLPKTTSFVELSVETCLRKYFAQEWLQNFKCEKCSSQNMLSSSAVFKKQGISKLPDCLILRINRVGWLPNGAPFKHVDHVKFDETLDVRDFLFYQNPGKKIDWKGRGDWTVRGGGDNPKSKLVALMNGNPNGDIVGGGEVDSTDGASTAALLRSFVAEDSNRYAYDLRAVVVHIGRPDSGHFVAYRRGWSPRAVSSTKRNTDGSPVSTNLRSAPTSPWFYTSDTEVKKVPFDTVASREAYMLFYERVAHG